MLPSRYEATLRRGRYTHHPVQGSLPLPAPASAPAAKPRRVRLRVISPAHAQPIPWLSRRGLLSRCCAFLGGLFAVCVVLILLGAEETNWAVTFRDSTLVFTRDELQKIWRWEIDSGHYPSNAKSEMSSIV